MSVGQPPVFRDAIAFLVSGVAALTNRRPNRFVEDGNNCLASINSRTIQKLNLPIICACIVAIWWSPAQASENALRYGNPYFIQNQYGSKAYLDTRGRGCEKNVYCVSAAATSTRDGQSGTWKIRPVDGQRDGEVVKFNDKVYLQNQYGSKAYLDTRGRGCENNVYCVSAANVNDRDNGSGTWVVMSAGGKLSGEPVMTNDQVYLQNQYGSKTYLDTRARGCESNVYCVSTADSNNRDTYSGSWTFTNSEIDPRLSKLDAADFVVYGDMPYGNIINGRTDAQVLSNAIVPYLRESKTLPFVIHVGDIGRPKRGEFNSCDDRHRDSTLEQWENISKALFYTPGDNDWTDCDREEASPDPSHPLDPLEELSKVRSMYPSIDVTLRNQYKIPNTELQQVNYPENQMWTNKNVLYVSIHVVGSENGWNEDENRQIEVTHRNAANFQWLDQARSYASASSVKALVIAMHVDLFVKNDKKIGYFDCVFGEEQYGEYCKNLAKVAYNLQKPVLLVHGDTNAHCLDQPIAGLPNFWRLNAPGDFKLIDADMVTIDASIIAKPFNVRRLLDNSEPPTDCNYERKRM